MVCLNMSLTCDYVALLHDHLQPLMDSMYFRSTNGLFQQDNTFCDQAQVPKISLRNILETSNKCDQHVYPIWTQLSIYEMWWTGLFALKISGSCEQLLRWHNATLLQMSSNHLWNECHIRLLYINITVL